MEDLLIKYFGDPKQVYVDPCFKCQLRNECKDVEKFIAFEQSIARQLTSTKMFCNDDPHALVKNIVEAHKDELVCENFINDESISDKLSTLGILKLQK